MFRSLQSRLWLSYAAMIFIVLLAFVVTITLSFFTNPYIYRDTVSQMRADITTLSVRAGSDLLNGSPQAESVLQNAAEQTGYRYLLVSSGRNVLADSGSGDNLFLARLRSKTFLTSDVYIAGFLRDSQLRMWLYTGYKLGDGNWLVAAEPRPKLILFNVLRDEVLGPVVLTGIGSLLVAVILAFVMAHQVSAPLRRLAQASKMLGAGKYPLLEEKGPQEVRQLAQAFNQMTHQVRESQQAQRDFLANVSHELKTPLTSIQGFAQAIQDGTVHDPQELERAAGVILNEANQMHRLVLDLLALTRLESGTADLVSEPVDLTLLLRAALDKFSLQAEKVGVSLKGQIEPLPEINGDGDRLSQVFGNLIDNALKYTQPGGQVTLLARRDGGSVVVQVKDTGIGISPEDQKRIFERFFQVDKSRKGGAGRGVGLGLAITRQITLAHHGELWLESSPGQGSTFFVRFPIPNLQTPSRKA
jgi:two-component system OmpR family sensor kinase